MLDITFLGIQRVCVVVEYTIAYLIWILFPRGNRIRVVEVIAFSTTQSARATQNSWFDEEYHETFAMGSLSGDMNNQENLPNAL